MGRAEHHPLLVVLGSCLALMAGFELIVRLTWTDKDGKPGLILGHPTRIEALAENYDGYFDRQPLHINNLGFRDDRDYSLEKGPRTFRIGLLGNSVTFGDGEVFHNTWGYQFEQRLRGWRPDVDWQVWNLAALGYDAVIELRQLDELGPKYKLDLVIVGVTPRDVHGKDFDFRPASSAWTYAVKAFAKKHFYSYAKLRLWAARLTARTSADKRLAEREQEQLAIAASDYPVASPADLQRFPMKHKLPGAPHAPVAAASYHDTGLSPQPPEPGDPEFKNMMKAVERLKQYQKEGRYRLVFLLQTAPDYNNVLQQEFIDGPRNGMNRFLTEHLSGPIPVVSTFDAFWSYRPSEVPGSEGHSMGTANKVKAEVLFDWFTNRPELLTVR